MKKSKIVWWLILCIVMTCGAYAIVTSQYENKTDLIIILFLGIMILMMFKSQMQEEKRAYRQLMEKNELIYGLEELKKAQTESMSGFAREIGEVVSVAVDESMKPVFQDIDKGMKDLLDSFGNIYKNGVEDIVNSFIIQMNESMGEQFSAWGENIKELCKWQKETTDSVSKVVKNLSGNTLKIKDVYTYTENIIKQLDNYYLKLNSLQEGVRKTFDTMSNCDGLFREVTKKQEECVNSFNKHEQSLIELLEKFKGLTGEYNEAVKTSAQGYKTVVSKQNDKISAVYSDFITKFSKSVNDQIQINLKLSKDMQLLMDNSANNLKEVSKKYDKDVEMAINKTFEQFDKNLAHISKHISGTVADINEITLNIPMALNSSFKEMQKQLASYIKAIEEMRVVAVKVVTHVKEKVENGEIVTPVELDEIKTPKKRTRRTKKEIEDAKGNETKKRDNVDKNVRGRD